MRARREQPSEEDPTVDPSELEHALEVLGCFRAGHTPLDTSQLCDRLGLDRQVVLGQVKALCLLGYLQGGEDGYRLGARAIDIGLTALVRCDTERSRPLRLRSEKPRAQSAPIRQKT